MKSINGNSKVESLTLYNSKTKSESKLDVDGIFVEMGYVARTDIVKDLVKLNDNKEIIVDKYCGLLLKGYLQQVTLQICLQTSYNFCRSRRFAAALSAYNYIQRLKGKPAIKADWKSLANKNSKTW